MKRLLTLTTASLILLGPSTIKSSAFDQNSPDWQTDATAGCTYGTKALSELTFTQPSSSENIHTGWRNADRCDLFMYWTSEVGPSFSYSAAQIFFTGTISGASSQAICDGPKDPNCDPKKYPNAQFRALSAFYHCTSITDLNCISNFYVIDPKGNSAEATYLREFPEVPGIPESNDASTWYPKGGSSPLYKFTSDTATYYFLPTGVTERDWTVENGSWGRASQSFHFGIQVGTLFEGVKGPTKPKLKEVPYSLPDGTVGKRVEFSRDTVAGFDAPCNSWLAIDDNACFVGGSFPSGYRYRIVFQLPADAGYFLNGRIENPIAFTEPLPKGRRVVIEGAPAKLFSVGGLLPKSVLTKKTYDYIMGTRYAQNLVQAPADFPPIENQYPGLLNEMLPYYGDRTTFEIEAWTLKSSNSLGRFTRECTDQSKGQILGITSSNATAFNNDPPVLDPVTKVLSYEVAAPHFGVDGKSVNVGHYYMNMNANFVKCILGVDQVPLYAQVGITYGGNTEEVMTASVSQDKDWLRMKVDNFHYSAPKLQIKFEQPASAPIVQPIPATNSPTKSASAKKLSTITCAKGKTTKKVTAVNPVCPNGYKKK